MAFGSDLIGLIFTAAIVVCAAFAGRTAENQPYRVKVCLVTDGNEKTTEEWSDFVEKTFKRHPGSYCGKCGKPEKCPGE